MALLHTQQRADDAGGQATRLRRRRPTPWHGAEASREDASIHRDGSAFALFDATSRCYRLGRFANRSSHQFHSSTAARKDVPQPASGYERGVGSASGNPRSARKGLGQYIPVAGTQARPVETISQRQPPERPSGFSVILRGRKRSLSPVTFASRLTPPGRGRRAVPSTVADGNCRGAHVAASALLFRLFQHVSRQSPDAAPSHSPIPFKNSRLEWSHHSRTRVENAQFPIGEIRNV